MNPIITLTTDFGANDAYTAAMKGVILSINPRVSIVDLCHQIEPQGIFQAAFVLGTAYSYFPKGTIHIVVVDPGVGTTRRALLLTTPSAFFLAPDNGVLSYIIEEASEREDSLPEDVKRPFLEAYDMPLGSDMEATILTNSRYWRQPVSATFHGRDIFAPVAAFLSLGISARDFGETASSIKALHIPRPKVRTDGTLAGCVLHIDRFGNLITNFRREDLPEVATMIEIREHSIQGLISSYEEGDGLLAIIGSSGHMEISVKNGSAADVLGAKVGDEVRIRVAR